MKRPSEPCYYNTEIDCCNRANCEFCGWNPDIADKRRENIVVPKRIIKDSKYFRYFSPDESGGKGEKREMTLIEAWENICERLEIVEKMSFLTTADAEAQRVIANALATLWEGVSDNA